MSNLQIVCSIDVIAVVFSVAALISGICLRDWFRRTGDIHICVGLVGLVGGLVAGMNITWNQSLDTIGYVTVGALMILGFGVGFLCLGLIFGRQPEVE